VLLPLLLLRRTALAKPVATAEAPVAVIVVAMIKRGAVGMRQRSAPPLSVPVCTRLPHLPHLVSLLLLPLPRTTQRIAVQILPVMTMTALKVGPLPTPTPTSSPTAAVPVRELGRCMGSSGAIRHHHQ
jgi:hypothetical protein